MTTGERWLNSVTASSYGATPRSISTVASSSVKMLCLVIDTRLHLGEAAGPAPIWGHVRAAADLAASGERQRAVAVQQARGTGRDDLADQIRTAPIDAPDRLVGEHVELVVGGRPVDLRFLGRGHTDGDLVVEIDCGDDCSVIFAGDLVEEGNPPGFDDAYPLDWAATLGRLPAASPYDADTTRLAVRRGWRQLRG